MEYNNEIDICIRKNASLYPEKIAVSDPVSEVTWKEFDVIVNKVANALLRDGVKPDEKIAVLASNSVTYAALFFGILRAGACVAPLSTLAASEQLLDMIRDSEARFLFFSSDYANVLAPIEDKVNELCQNRVVVFDGEDTGKDYRPFSFFLSGVSEMPADVMIHPDLGFNLIYSSGTTGTPKGILQSRRHRMLESEFIIEAFKMNDEARSIIATPLYSNTTLFLFLSVMLGGGSVYMMKKFDARRYLELSEAFHPTHQVLVPVQYERLLRITDFEAFNLNSYKIKLCTSAPLQASVKQDILQRWPAGGLTEIYGMTEGGVLCTLSCTEHPNKLDTVGQPASDCDLRIISDDDKELPLGMPGEIVGRSSKMMMGYWKRPEATEQASWTDNEGRRFQRSGDIGWLDDEGFLHLLDRKKDVIISGGFNVYAVDLEKALLAHDSVSEAAVVGAPSEEWGETPIAFVVPVDLEMFEAEKVRTAVNGKLGKGQRISEIRAVVDLPRNPIGKILKRELKQLV